jgi:hypothetical protein
MCAFLVVLNLKKAINDFCMSLREGEGEARIKIHSGPVMSFRQRERERETEARIENCRGTLHGFLALVALVLGQGEKHQHRPLMVEEYEGFINIPFVRLFLLLLLQHLTYILKPKGREDSQCPASSPARDLKIVYNHLMSGATRPASPKDHLLAFMFLSSASSSVSIKMGILDRDEV